MRYRALGSWGMVEFVPTTNQKGTLSLPVVVSVVLFSSTNSVLSIKRGLSITSGSRLCCAFLFN